MSSVPNRPPRFARLREGGPRALAAQVALVAVLLAVLIWLGINAHAALQARGMASGFGFLSTPTTFSMGQSFFSAGPNDSYLHAFAAGLGNTVMISLISIITASVIGSLLGIAALADNPMLRALARCYVYVFRNTPQLLQIIFWYTFFTLLPITRHAWSLFGVAYASNRGMTIPWPVDTVAAIWVLVALVAGLVLAIVAGRLWPRLGLLSLLAVLLVPPLVVWLCFGAPFAMSVPQLGRFNFSGGLTLPPEFMAIYFGLSFYIAAFIAEIVRGGVQGVDAGQIEAARTIGLSRSQIMLRVVAPQALRLIIPPLAAQYISLVKNSSLGVAVGFPDLFSVSNTALTYSGRTIEVLVLMGAIYLLISLLIGTVAAVFNRFVQFPNR